MRQQGVTLEQVMEGTSDALDVGLLRFSDGNRIGTGGFIDTPNQRLLVKHVLPIVTPNDLAQVAVKEQRRPDAVRLADVANVTIGTQPLAGDAVVNGGPGLLLIVEKYPWGNTLAGDARRGGGDQGAAARSAGRHVRHPHLPRRQLHRRLDSTISRVSLLIGALLVILVLVVFLFEWRTALISIVVDPALARRRRPRALLREATRST